MFAEEIVKKAKALGYDKCGIIPVEELAGYEGRLEARIKRFPKTADRYGGLFPLASPQKKYPWARSVVVCTYWYGNYRIPESLLGRIGKYYLTDGRRNKASRGYKASVNFEAYLRELGLRIVFDRDFGITALRWAAMKAGLGIIRKNNFFYTEKGSWQYIEAFLIDQALVYKGECRLRPCGEKCGLCIRACPSGSLCEAYTMNRNTCVSCLTT